MVFDKICELVRIENESRNFSTVNRRAVKMLEEIGEVAEAWLNVTSPSNGKAKTWDDVREEIADCLIVALDIAWTKLPTEDEHPGVMMQRNSIDYADIEKITFDIAFCASAYGQALCTKCYALARQHCRRMLALVADLSSMKMPDQQHFTGQQIEHQLLLEIYRKLAKWSYNRANMMVVTDDV